MQSTVHQLASCAPCASSVAARLAKTSDRMQGMVLEIVFAVIGYEAVELTDRWAATRAPGAPFPAWFGHDAALRILSRPRSFQVFCQAIWVLCFAAGVWQSPGDPRITGALLGGTVRVAIGVLHFYVWPIVFHVDTGRERNIGNRLFPLEQDTLQQNNRRLVEHEARMVPAFPGSDHFPRGQVDAGRGQLPAEYAFPIDTQPSRSLE